MPEIKPHQALAAYSKNAVSRIADARQTHDDLGLRLMPIIGQGGSRDTAFTCDRDYQDYQASQRHYLWNRVGQTFESAGSRDFQVPCPLPIKMAPNSGKCNQM